MWNRLFVQTLLCLHKDLERDSSEPKGTTYHLVNLQLRAHGWTFNCLERLKDKKTSWGEREGADGRGKNQQLEMNERILERGSRAWRSSVYQCVLTTAPYLQHMLSSRAVECDNGVCVLSIKRHYHTK